MYRETIIKRIAVFLIMTLTFTAVNNPCWAYERTGHDSLFEQLFFGANDVNEDNVEILEAAAYLAIDQFNWKSTKSGEKDLNYLKGKNVKGLPKSVSEIDYSASGATHRSYTHNGWNHVYPDDKGHWETRKSIIVNSVSSVVDVSSLTPEQLDSFCSLIYYSHILGDFLDDNYSRSKNNGTKIQLGGTPSTNAKEDGNMISAVISDCEVLFADQKFTPRYMLVMISLNAINVKAKTYGDGSSINNDEEYQKFHKLSENMRDILISNLPNLLENEDFFEDAFIVK